MALISCPKCGQSVSDKATSCPRCGFALFVQNASLRNVVKCDDCGIEYERNLSACPACGCPSPYIGVVPQKQKRKHKAVIVVAILLAAMAIIGILGFGAIKAAEKKQYYNNMETVTYMMLDGAADAETAGNLIKSVWYNAIFEERDSSTDKYTMQNGRFVDDFNDALSNLFSDAAFIENISKIEDNQSQVTALMKELRNPPKEYEEAYSVLKTYYDNYLRMTKMVISPTGSLQSFSEEFNVSDTDTVNSFEKMKLYLD